MSDIAKKPPRGRSSFIDRVDNRAIQSRYWCFTLNNPTAAQTPEAVGAIFKDYGSTFFICQGELSSTGTPHLQGYVEFRSNKRLSGMQAMLRGPHYEPRAPNSSREANVAYCSKEPRTTEVYQYGVDKQPGKRSDLVVLHELIKQGKTEGEIAESNFALWARNYRAVDRYRVFFSKDKRNWHSFCTVLWGPPGVGKSRIVASLAPDAYYVMRPAKGQAFFFDGYTGQEDVVIDEFTGSFFPRVFMNSLIDRYPLRVQVKGGTVNFLARRIWVLSNFNPREWYLDGLGPLERRLTGELGVIYHVDSSNFDFKQVKIVQTVDSEPPLPPPAPVSVAEHLSSLNPQSVSSADGRAVPGLRRHPSEEDHYSSDLPVGHPFYIPAVDTLENVSSAYQASSTSSSSSSSSKYAPAAMEFEECWMCGDKHHEHAKCMRMEPYPFS